MSNEEQLNMDVDVLEGLSSKDPQSRYWCSTYNNYTDEIVSQYRALAALPTTSYMVFGREVGKECGTPHLQTYIEFSTKRRFTVVKRLLGGVRVAIRKKTAKQASDYCKKDGDFEEFGCLSDQRQGKRNDLSEAANAIKNGATKRSIAQAFPEMFIKFHKGIGELIEVLKEKKEPCEFTEKKWNLVIDWTKTQIFKGTSGCGKTTLALQELPNALFITHLDELRLFDPDTHDGIIVDEGNFKHLPRETQIHFMDNAQSRSIHIRYTYASIPRGTKKIITTNLPKEQILIIDPAIERRIQWHELDATEPNF